MTRTTPASPIQQEAGSEAPSGVWSKTLMAMGRGYALARGVRLFNGSYLIYLVSPPEIGQISDGS
jgi:hypothetical protein